MSYDANTVDKLLTSQICLDTRAEAITLVRSRYWLCRDERMSNIWDQQGVFPAQVCVRIGIRQGLIRLARAARQFSWRKV